MKKKLTRDSFSTLKSQAVLLDEAQQRAIKGGGYFDDYGIGYYDADGNYYWTRTSEGNSAFYGDYWDSSSSSSGGQDGSGLYVYNSTSGYGTSINPLSIDDYNQLAILGRWNGGYVGGFGYIGTYASSVEYGNSIYLAGSWYPYGDSRHPVSEVDFNDLVDQGKWHGGYVQGLGYVVEPIRITGSTGGGVGANSGYFNISDATSYLIDHANSGSTSACALYVRLAIEAGGLSTTDHPTPARDYDTYLPSIGFSVVDPVNYIPQAGDIVVHEANSQSNPAGHIAMYTGSQWISDFVQIDMFGGPAYRNNPNYTILRWNP